MAEIVNVERERLEGDEQPQGDAELPQQHEGPQNGGQADIEPAGGDAQPQQQQQQQAGAEQPVKKKNQRGTRAGWRVREAKKIDFLARLNVRMGQIVAQSYHHNWRGGRGGSRRGQESS
ncbi:uncharacterized protein [Venturia canescens]|uniref:uncharacterized protein n=1 Tax=Venturia canescens TaxID=32260 RepID=UPI001C9CBAB6|nr:uncharacterized protein LOC122415298 [Venturia canescens]